MMVGGGARKIPPALPFIFFALLGLTTLSLGTSGALGVTAPSDYHTNLVQGERLCWRGVGAIGQGSVQLLSKQQFVTSWFGNGLSEPIQFQGGSYYTGDQIFGCGGSNVAFDDYYYLVKVYDPNSRGWNNHTQITATQLGDQYERLWPSQNSPRLFLLKAYSIQLAGPIDSWVRVQLWIHSYRKFIVNIDIDWKMSAEQDGQLSSGEGAIAFGATLYQVGDCLSISAQTGSSGQSGWVVRLTRARDGSLMQQYNVSDNFGPGQLQPCYVVRASDFLDGGNNKVYGVLLNSLTQKAWQTTTVVDAKNLAPTITSWNLTPNKPSYRVGDVVTISVVAQPNPIVNYSIKQYCFAIGPVASTPPIVCHGGPSYTFTISNATCYRYSFWANDGHRDSETLPKQGLGVCAAGGAASNDLPVVNPGDCTQTRQCPPPNETPKPLPVLLYILMAIIAVLVILGRVYFRQTPIIFIIGLMVIILLVILYTQGVMPGNIRGITD